MQKKSYSRPTLLCVALHSEAIVAATDPKLGLDDKNNIDSSNNIYSRQADNTADDSFWNEDNTGW